MGVGTGREDLLGEVRVAAGAVVHTRDGLRVGLGSEDAFELQRGLGAAEAIERDLLDAVRSLQVAEEPTGGIVDRRLVRSVGQDKREPLGSRVLCEEPEQVTGRAVGPVEVLEDENDR